MRSRLWTAVLSACTGSPEASESTTTCNGHEALCDRTYDQVAYPATHNSMSNEEEGWLIPNQTYPVSTQLADGIRVINYDLHYYDDQVYLCHGSDEWFFDICLAGSRPLVDALDELRDFLLDHPRDVLTLVFESYVTAEDAVESFEASGLDTFAYAHEPNAPWPTLDDLIQANQRLVVAVDNDGGSPNWFHSYSEHFWGTTWNMQDLEDMGCEADPDAVAHGVFDFPHFLTDPVALPELAAEANPTLLQRAQQCHEALGHIPNLVMVDFYELGSLIETVDTLNGL